MVLVCIVLCNIGCGAVLDSSLIEARNVVSGLNSGRDPLLQLTLRVESGLLIARVSFQDMFQVVDHSAVVLRFLHEVHTIHVIYISLLIDRFVQRCVDESGLHLGPVQVRDCFLVRELLTVDCRLVDSTSQRLPFRRKFGSC